MSPASGFVRANWFPLLVLGLAATGAIHPAHAAATAGGGTMPWDTPLTTIKNDLTGPVAFVISLLGMLACGVALVFGGEINEFIRRIIFAVLVASFVAGVAAAFTAFGITGALV